MLHLLICMQFNVSGVIFDYYFEQASVIGSDCSILELEETVDLLIVFRLFVCHPI